MDKLEETLIRINNRLELNEVLKGMEGNIIDVNVEDVKVILQELKDCIKKIKLINEMAEFLIGFPVFNYNGELETTLKDKEDVIKYFEKRCKNAKD